MSGKQLHKYATRTLHPLPFTVCPKSHCDRKLIEIEQWISTLKSQAHITNSLVTTVITNPTFKMMVICSGPHKKEIENYTVYTWTIPTSIANNLGVGLA